MKKFILPNKCMVISPGKFLRFLFLLLAPLYFAACSNPSGSGQGSTGYTVTFKSNYDADATLHTKTVHDPATAIGAEDFPDNPSRTDYIFAGWNTSQGGSGTPFTAWTTVNADTTVYAQWAKVPPGSHAVTAAMNDETETPWTVIVTPPATAIDAEDFPDNPSWPGYIFAGWNTEPDGSGDPFTASDTISEDTTVYAQWTEVPSGSYTVTFAMNDGTDAPWTLSIVTPPVTAIDAEDFPANPARTGYSFGGWNTQADGLGEPFTASATVDGDITVYAKWVEVPSGSYAVTFAMNDRTDAPWALNIVSSGAAIGAGDFPANPSRTGYTFGGWNTESDGSGDPFTASDTISEDTTVYAQWTGETYTVTFMRNHDGSDTVILYTKTVIVPVTAIDTTDFPANPTRTGYEFGGWYAAQNGSGTPFTDTTTVDGDITVYAKWDSYSYTVTFDSDGGTTEANPATKTVASPATHIDALPTQPSKTGYNFGGWYTAKNGLGDPFTDSTTVDGNITVYANWDSYSYTVTFDKDGGDTEADPATKTVASPATNVGSLPVPPKRTGYDFGGWYTAQNGGGTPFTAATVVNGNIPVYAKWTGKTYTVTFKSNYEPDTILYTKTVTVPATAIGTTDFPAPPTRTDYNFAGWNTQADGLGDPFTDSTTVSASIPVYAQWSRGTITLNLEDAGDGAFSQGSFTISKTGSESQTVTVTGLGYTNPQWFVDGDLKGTGMSITINAADYAPGDRNLSLFISKNGVTWSKEIAFTVTD